VLVEVHIKAFSVPGQPLLRRQSLGVPSARDGFLVLVLPRCLGCSFPGREATIVAVAVFSVRTEGLSGSTVIMLPFTQLANHCNAIVTALLGRPRYVNRTETSGSDATPAGTRKFTWL
jgi:hypothetical protein